ncbi:MAG: fibronectin type III domain-containing protein, partial [Pseudobdellovibrionaceae bacterium]
IRSTVPNMTFRNLELGAEGTNRNGEDGIQGNGDNLLVENCFIHGNDSVSTHGDGIQWFSGNNIVMRYNIFKNNGQHMMLTETAWGNDYVTNLEIHHNVFYNRGGDHYNGLSKKLCPPTGIWKVYHNTFDLESKDDSGYNNIFSGAGSCKAMEFRNNAVLNSHAGSLGNVTHAYNGYDNSAPYLTYQIPSTETGKVVAADLGMVDVANANYRLMASSPLIGKGENLGYTRDFDGNPLPANPSMGAFEYASGGTTPLPGDTAAPSVPMNVSATAVSTSQINLTWNASTDNVAVTKYSIYRNGALVGSTTGVLSYASQGLAAGTSYTFQVEASDAAGNKSAKSASVSAQTMVADTTEPVRSSGSPMGTLAAGSTSTVIALSTNEKSTCRYSTNSNTAFANMTGNLTASSSGLTHNANVSGLSNGQTYNYYVRCQDLAGNTNGMDYVISFSVAQPTDPVVQPPTNFRIKSMRIE